MRRRIMMLLMAAMVLLTELERKRRAALLKLVVCEDRRRLIDAEHEKQDNDNNGQDSRRGNDVVKARGRNLQAQHSDTGADGKTAIDEGCPVEDIGLMTADQDQEDDGADDQANERGPVVHVHGAP